MSIFVEIFRLLYFKIIMMIFVKNKYPVHIFHKEQERLSKK